jgi:hypothetical protein
MPVTAPIDQFAQLPHLTWRDSITLPISDRTHRFSHDGTDHQVIYRNGVSVEMTGAGARVFSYTVPLREGITNGPYGGLFSRTLLTLYRAYHDDKSPGILYDPIYGPVLCVPQEWDETADVQKRDGVDVRLSWKEHSPLDGSDASTSSNLDTLQTDAARLDEEVAAIDWPKQQPPPPATQDPLSLGAGILQQGNWLVARSKAKVADVAYRFGEVEDAAREAEGNGVPGAGFVRQDARRGRLRATKVANAPTRDTATAIVEVTTTAPSDLFETARRLGISVQELLEFNPALSRSPTIPTGTRVKRRAK